MRYALVLILLTKLIFRGDYLYKLFNDDCFKVMAQLIDEGIKVDAIIADPPYNIDYADWDNGFNISRAIDLCFDLLKITAT